MKSRRYFRQHFILPSFKKKTRRFTAGLQFSQNHYIPPDFKRPQKENLEVVEAMSFS